MRDTIQADRQIAKLLKPERKSEFFSPGSVWAHRVNGHWELVYLHSLTSRLIRNSSREVDFYTPFGLEHLPREKFLSQFTPVGWARVKFEGLASLDNIRLEVPPIYIPGNLISGA